MPWRCPTRMIARSEPLGVQEVGTPPTILFQGSLHDGPNIDGVDWLIDEVAPYLWDQLPGVQIRLVGTTSTTS